MSSGHFTINLYQEDSNVVRGILAFSVDLPGIQVTKVITFWIIISENEIAPSFKATNLSFILTLSISSSCSLSIGFWLESKTWKILSKSYFLPVNLCSVLFLLLGNKKFENYFSFNQYSFSNWNRKLFFFGFFNFLTMEFSLRVNILDEWFLFLIFFIDNIMYFIKHF